jgi:hypothetical protein
MPPIQRCVVALLLLVAPLVQAQPSLTFGEPLPLTNTRYGPRWGFPMLETNGSDFFVFWRTETNLRVTRLVEGEHRVGRHVLPVSGTINDNLAVTWTGRQFLVLMSNGGAVTGQLLDANAEPAGGSFLIVDRSMLGAAASNGQTVLMLHWTSDRVDAMALTPAGQPTGVRSTVVTPGAGNGLSDVASNGTGFAAVVSTLAGTVAVTYDAQGREQSRTFLFTGTHPEFAAQVSIESNGDDYLAAWQLADGTVEAAHVGANGAASRVVTVDVPPPDRFGASRLDVTWTGANWAVAYVRDVNDTDSRLRVAYVHPTLPQVTGTEDAGRGAFPTMATAGGRAMLLWSVSGGTDAPPVLASPLPLAGHTPEPVTFAAGEQEMAAVASTADSALVVWNEYGNGESVLRAGVRTANGDWAEREIFPQLSFQTLAATDGHDFVVTTDRPGGASAIFLDATSRVTAGPVPLPFGPWAITWTGTDYLLTDGFALARLSRSGMVSPVVTGGNFIFLALASNGSAVMAVMIEPEPCPILCPGPFGRPRFARLGPDLRPIGEPRFIFPGDQIASDARLVWDGTRFVAAIPAHNGVDVVELPLDAGEPRVLAILESNVWRRVHLSAVEGGVAVTWRESIPFPGSLRTRVAVTGHDDSVRSTVIDDGGHSSTLDPFVTALPNGSLGVLVSTPQLAAPHHGSLRVLMHVGGAALPQKPDAPRLTGAIRNGRVELDWTAPPQPVAGYRVEYRIGDGAWNELDAWLDADDDDIRIALPIRERTLYRFRIRAFNDAGPSEYSAPVVLNVSKRRAVR